jgi:multiple sugar transport system permease protein
MLWGASQKTAMLDRRLSTCGSTARLSSFLFLAGIQSLPKSPFESAKIDGGSAWFNFKTMTLPISSPAS